MSSAILSVELTDHEARTLREILCDYLSDLGLEISDAESLDFRERLKQRETFVKRLLQGLGGDQG